MTLSKSDYLLYRECPHNAWYKVNKPDIYFESELSDFEKAIIETGNEVELLARHLFCDGVLIEGRGKDAQKHTQELLSQQEGVIFQAIFEKAEFLAAADVLKFNEEKGLYSIYEVKATNAIDNASHYHDLAFQVNIMNRLGYQVGSINLIHLNANYVRSGDLDISQLFEIEDVTEEVLGLYDEVTEEMEEALRYISAISEPPGPCCCIYKGRSSHCATFQYSNPSVPDYGVHDIARIGSSKAKLKELADGEAFHFHEIPEHIKLTEIQKNQVDALLLDKVIVKQDKISEELEGLTFPLYFLDYETFPCAIPRFDGFAPYQQIPFQYSLYVLESEDAELRHFEYLCTSNIDPSHGFLSSLQNDIEERGSIIVWNKSFECKINRELAQRISGITDYIESVNERVYDLMEIFRKQYYIHKDFRGKTSIKTIFPVLVPEMTYEELEIQEGGTASQRWNELVTGSLSNAEKEGIADNLKEYCKMDTYAMYAIWKHLRSL